MKRVFGWSAIGAEPASVLVTPPTQPACPPRPVWMRPTQSAGPGHRRTFRWSEVSHFPFFLVSVFSLAWMGSKISILAVVCWGRRGWSLVCVPPPLFIIRAPPGSTSDDCTSLRRWRCRNPRVVRLFCWRWGVEVSAYPGSSQGVVVDSRAG